VQLLNDLLDFYETLHICSTLPADVHEGIPQLIVKTGAVAVKILNTGILAS
jgi:hypothetical protein